MVVLVYFFVLFMGLFLFSIPLVISAIICSRDQMKPQVEIETGAVVLYDFSIWDKKIYFCQNMKFLDFVPNWVLFVTNTKTFAFTQINQCPLMLLMTRHIHCLLVYVVCKFIINPRCTTSVSDFNSRALLWWIFGHSFTSSGPFNSRYLGTKMTNMPVRLRASQYQAGPFFCHTILP